MISDESRPGPGFVMDDQRKRLRYVSAVPGSDLTQSQRKAIGGHIAAAAKSDPRRSSERDRRCKGGKTGFWQRHTFWFRASDNTFLGVYQEIAT